MTNRVTKHTISNMVFFAAFLLSAHFQAESVEARNGALRTRSVPFTGRRRQNLPYTGSDLSYIVVEPTFEHEVDEHRPVLGLQTDVADLAKDFHDAISAVNRGDENIHVGKLLKACECLEDTMRKIGLKQGAKDIGGNIAKIRNLYQKAPPERRDSMPELLLFEIESGVHGSGNGVKRIKDPSAAMGFLWLGRTINYQHHMFRLMLDEQQDPYDAARRAYDQDLKQYHSWPVQKICQAAMVSLKSMKRTSVLSTLGGFQENNFGEREKEATDRDIHRMMDSWKPMLCRWKKVFSDLNLENL